MPITPDIASILERIAGALEESNARNDRWIAIQQRWIELQIKWHDEENAHLGRQAALLRKAYAAYLQSPEG